MRTVYKKGNIDVIDKRIKNKINKYQVQAKHRTNGRERIKYVNNPRVLLCVPGRSILCNPLLLLLLFLPSDNVQTMCSMTLNVDSFIGINFN